VCVSVSEWLFPKAAVGPHGVGFDRLGDQKKDENRVVESCGRHDGMGGDLNWDTQAILHWPSTNTLNVSLPFLLGVLEF
jgi:hypothetical protein